MDTYHPDTPTYVSKDVTIRGYLAKLKRAREQNVWETLLKTLNKIAWKHDSAVLNQYVTRVVYNILKPLLVQSAPLQ
jgi:hypothetical protein